MWIKNGSEIKKSRKEKRIKRARSGFLPPPLLPKRNIKRKRKIVHRFCKFVNFSNFTGGDHALDLYLEWIQQETDLAHEKENIKVVDPNNWIQFKNKGERIKL